MRLAVYPVFVTVSKGLELIWNASNFYVNLAVATYSTTQPLQRIFGELFSFQQKDLVVFSASVCCCFFFSRPSIPILFPQESLEVWELVWFPLLGFLIPLFLLGSLGFGKHRGIMVGKFQAGGARGFPGWGMSQVNLSHGLVALGRLPLGVYHSKSHMARRDLAFGYVGIQAKWKTKSLRILYHSPSWKALIAFELKLMMKPSFTAFFATACT